VRIGIVGVGGRGTSLLQTLLTLPAVEIIAVCDLLRERTDQAQQLVARKTGRTPEAYVKGELGWQQLVGRNDLDAVITATPWEWHTPVAVGAMRAGKYAGVESRWRSVGSWCARRRKPANRA
jgi:predicted dehydrogenase